MAVSRVTVWVFAGSGSISDDDFAVSRVTVWVFGGSGSVSDVDSFPSFSSSCRRFVWSGFCLVCVCVCVRVCVCVLAFVEKCNELN